MSRTTQITAAVALTICLAPAMTAETIADLAQRLQALEQLVSQQQSRIEQQQLEIARLQGNQEAANAAADRLEAGQVLPARADDLDRFSLSQVQDLGGVSLGKHVDRLQLKGDLRVRYERQETDPDSAGATDKERERFRQRYRLGLTWQASEGWDIAVGIATGDSSGATSTNDTYSDGSAFETGDLGIDYAYARHEWDTGTSLTLGQQKNPFVTTWVVWDSDVRPVGATLQQDLDPAFLTLGVYEVERIGSGARDTNSSRLLAGQFGIGYEGEGFDATLAAGYYHFNEGPTQVALADNSGSGVSGNSQYEVHILDLYGEIGADLGGAAVTLFGQYVNNFGADGAGGGAGDGQMGGTLDPEDEDQAWMIGVKGTANGFKASYAYAHIEADAVHGDLNDSDFGSGLGGLNVEGHKFSLGYTFTKNFSLGGTILLADELKAGGGDSDQEDDLYQIDAVYKF